MTLTQGLSDVGSAYFAAVPANFGAFLTLLLQPQQGSSAGGFKFTISVDLSLKD